MDGLQRLSQWGALIVNCFGISDKYNVQHFYDNDPNTGYSDASELSNTGRYPFFVAVCCHTGDFSSSASETAAQDFLFEANRGAIAWFSPYGNTNAYHDLWLAKDVYRRILGEGITAIGPATTLAKIAFMARYPEHKDSAQQFCLFGDPALRLAFNPGELVSDVSPSDPVVPTGTAYGNASGSGTGYVQMNWSANSESDIAGYKVYLFNGDQYQEVEDVGNLTSWSSQGKGVWPTLSEILNGGYLLHTDGLGGELWDDPHWVYTNSPGTTYDTRTNYALRIKAYDYSGNLSGFSDAWAPTLPNTRFPTAQNSSFEQISGSDIVDWDTYGSGTFDSSTQYMDGTRSAHLSRSSAAGTFGFYQRYIAVQPNTTYYLGVWVKTQGVTSGAAYAALGVWAEGAANHHTDFGAVSGNSDWTYISGSWTSWSNEDRIEIKLYGYSEFVGEAWFDGLYFGTEPPPSGPIATNTTWSGTVHIGGDVTVLDGVTLTISPGTEVRFAANSDDQHGGYDPDKCELIVEGTLEADGVTFRSDSGSPANSDWQGIKVDGGSINLTNSTVQHAQFGVYLWNTGSVTLRNNEITQCGTGIWGSGEVTISGNTVWANSWNGISLVFVRSSSFLDHNLITNNGNDGVEITSLISSFLSMENNTIVGNEDDGIYVSSAVPPTIKNSIIVSNNGYGINGSSASISYNDVWGNSDGNYHNCSAGTGDISLDPRFVNAEGGDYHLRLLSPCIDAGDPVSDYTQEPLPNGGRINMGRYGNTPEAATSLEGTVMVFQPGPSDGCDVWLENAWNKNYYDFLILGKTNYCSPK